MSASTPRWAGGLGLALSSAWVLAGVEGAALVSHSVLGRFPLVGALVGLWTVCGLAFGALGVGSQGLWGRARMSTTARVGEPTWLMAGVLPLGVLALHRVGRALSDRSAETMLLGVLGAALLVAPLLGAVRAGIARVTHVPNVNIGRRVGRPAQVLFVALSWGALLGSVWLSHQDYLHELFALELGWGTVAFVVPLLAGSAGAEIGRWVSSRPAASRVSSHRALGRWASSRSCNQLLALVGVLAFAGLGMGVLAVRQASPAEARALRDHDGASRPLVALALWVGVPTPNLGRAQGLRGCVEGAELGAPGSVGRVGASAPDILLITVDGLRFDHTSLAAGSAHPNTPLLLARADQAAVFTRAYTPAPSTRAAFRAIFTGLLPGQVDGPPDARFPWALTLTSEQPTLAAYLRDAGYATVAYVSKPKAFPVATHALSGFNEVDDAATAFHLRYQHSAQLKVSRIIGRLAEPPAAVDAPRFVWTHLIEPHFPYTHGPLQAGEEPARGNEARHDLAVRYIDEQLERLLAFALAPERRDRTIVIITADHGEAFGEHRNSRHGTTVFEEELHVPLLIFGPGITPGARTTPVSLVDLLPTLLRLVGLDPAVGLCGEGWAQALTEGGEPHAQPVYAAALPDRTTRYHQLAFVEAHQKLVVDGETGAHQRFDLRADPHERNPDPDSRAARALRARLDAFLRERGLPLPLAH